jgi:hypothetical protein
VTQVRDRGSCCDGRDEIPRLRMVADHGQGRSLESGRMVRTAVRRTMVGYRQQIRHMVYLLGGKRTAGIISMEIQK